MNRVWIAVCVALAVSASAAQAATIYAEDFSNQDGRGAAGPTPSLNTGLGETWTIDVSSASLGASDDWFRVENGVFEARDTDGPAIWFSPLVDVSNFTNLNLSAVFSEDGDLEAFPGTGGDFINIEYSLDGGSNFSLISNVNGFGTATTSLTGDTPDDDDWMLTTLDQALSNGSIFQMRVTMQNFAGTEFLRMDDILLTGDVSTPVIPLPPAGLLLAGGLGALALRRRRRAA